MREPHPHPSGIRVEIAGWMGHSPEMNLGTYSHVIADLEGLTATDPEQVIYEARGDMVENRSRAATASTSTATNPLGYPKPSQGLEPWTPSLP